MTAPLGLRMLCRATGLPNNDRDTAAAYTVAQNLVDVLDHDCNPTYSAITDLAQRLDPDYERHERELTTVVRKALAQTGTQQEDEGDFYGRVALTTMHASFLLGAAYAFVAMSALSAPERSGGTR